MKSAPSSRRALPKFLLPGCLLLGLVTAMLHGVFMPGHTLFANDGPLGRLMSQCHRLPERFFGNWDDLNGVGSGGGALPPSISLGLQWLFGPIWFSKLYAVVSLLILGASAWCFFFQWGWSPPACVLGSFAAVLNSSFFSVACWGVSAHVLTVAMTFLALAALADRTGRPVWQRLVLAGLAVGMAVVEGADMGAIFSVYVAAFMIYQAFLSGGSRVKAVAAGVGKVAVVAVVAGVVAAQAISALVGTNILGVKGTKQDAQTRADRWDWATAWSLPKKEALGLVVPGLFGYRMDTLNGGAYWGSVGRSIAWENYLKRPATKPSRGFLRYTGGGNYAGILVVLLAVYAAAQSWRKKDSPFNPVERRWIWFWVAVAAVSLLLAFGKYAPFYHWVYELPYFSTIRNPAKFLDPMSVALVVLFAYGVDGLWRRHMQAQETRTFRSKTVVQPPPVQFGRFERIWVAGCGLVLVLSLLAWWIYASSHDALVRYLEYEEFSPTLSESLASFSINQVGWFVLSFALAAGLVAWIMRGGFRGAQARRGGILLGVLLVADLGRADQPWIRYWDYVQKYASNPVIDILRQQPYEHRVALLPLEPPPPYALLTRLYRVEWLQQEFPYYNIQSFDVVEMPRVAQDFGAFVQALEPTNDAEAPFLMHRDWELTNTKYLLGAAGFINPLNQMADPVQHRFRIVERFRIVPKPGYTRLARPDQATAVEDPEGPYALFEFDGVLPRAKLYYHWTTLTNNADALLLLVNPDFHPSQEVVVTGTLPAPATNAPSAEAAPVEFVHYAPKDIVLSCRATAAAVLLLNDRFDPNWHVRVDGQPAALLRCNFIMRGVAVTPGAHTVEFTYRPPVRLFYVSLGAIAAGLVVLGITCLGWGRGRVKGRNGNEGLKMGDGKGK